MSIPPAAVVAMRKELLAWYRKHRRDLPWRATPGNPYHTLVSEAMLQKTQVATVIAYFHRFVAAFPTVEVLANADEEQVLKLWQGLGYYRRARNLHAAARMIVSDFGGQVPASVEALLKLPGVGRYTAGAIASIAHGQASPILDGNVARVLARVFLLKEAVDQPRTLATLWSLAEELVDAAAPGDFNQAMMELGALVCTPKNPGCLVCPWRERCQALEAEIAEQLPVKTERKKPSEVEHLVALLRSGEKILVVKRPSKGLWSNLWELPTWELNVGVDGSASGLKTWLKQEHGVVATRLNEVESFVHQTTHRTIRFRVFEGRGKSEPEDSGLTNRQWRTLEEAAELPFSNPQRRVLGSVR